jgi:bifunctional ADP-heptose synthase (sugar kinase/adenylyltransferase)
MKSKFKYFFDNKERPKVLVIGDLILDEYLWGGMTRISPEAPVPILETKSENLSLGGAKRRQQFSRAWVRRLSHRGPGSG